MKKVIHIFLNAMPVLLMIGLIPFVSDDGILAAVYCAIIVIAFLVERSRHDIPVFVFGFVAMLIVGFLFVSTGADRFNRNGLFGVMPLWLPFLWAYGFVAIGRSIKELNS